MHALGNRSDFLPLLHIEGAHRLPSVEAKPEAVGRLP